MEPPGKRARARLVVGGDGAAFWLLAGGARAPLRPQHELGIAADGAGGVVAGSDPAARARRKDRGAGGDEVSGAGGPRGGGTLRTDGRRFHRAPLRYAAGRATLCGLAHRLARGPRAHSVRAGTVFENAAATTGGQADGGRTSRARSGDGGGYPASRQPAAHRSHGGNEWPTTGADAAPDRKRAPGTGADGGTNRKGAGGETC